ncbi:hypothetical protein BDP27DRAFT_1402001 [Rhodocollybia butyracea]|uniref:DUF6533 domain-containing protein n=1 Tax=Rhodocollybia butyracea TaxID=206335 RepID=A0A9P5PQU1_9AGAR|nr:hypothetical protein BDP27DRAFT_1402001 [Rhodocollybia butyracea]
MTVSLTPEEVVKYLDDRNLLSCLLISSGALFLYDWMLMLPVELDVVWSKKLRPLDVLYIIQRYMPFVDTIGILFVGKDDVELCGTYKTKYMSYPFYHQWMNCPDRSSRTFIPSPVPQVGCVILGTDSMFFLVWVILMVYEAVILTLLLIPGLPYCIIYYLFLFGLSVANLLTALLLPHNLQILFVPCQRVIQTLLTSRVILHIRSQLRKPTTILLRDL